MKTLVCLFDWDESERLLGKLDCALRKKSDSPALYLFVRSFMRDGKTLITCLTKSRCWLLKPQKVHFRTARGAWRLFFGMRGNKGRPSALPNPSGTT